MSRSQSHFMHRVWSRMLARMRQSRRVMPQRPRGLRLGFEYLEDRAVPASVVFAESTFDPEEFGRHISAVMDYNFVGYAYAVNYNGNVAVATGTGGLNGPNAGLARTIMDDPETAFTTDTRIEQNSVSKIITAVTVLHLLDSQYDDLEAALSLPISEFLPSDWTYGLYVDSLTVRHLLTHTSGFYEGGPDDTPNAIGVNFQLFGNNNFQNLRTLVETSPGIPTGTMPDGSLAYPRGYSNANFSLLAKMIPYMMPDNLRDELDEVSANDPGSADAVFGEYYRDYVRDHILTPSGIVNPSMDGSGENPAMGYDFATAESDGGTSQSDHMNTGGAFGWNLSAPEMAHFLHALSHTETLLSDEARAVMNSDEFLLGWSPGTFSGNPYVIAPLRDAFGPYFGHGGAGQGFRSEVAVLPGGVQAALAMNSGANEALLEDNPDHLALDRSRLLRFAYQNSWSTLVIEGDEFDNEFVVRPNADDPTRIDIVSIADNVEDIIASPSIDFTMTLHLRGLGGNDTFRIEDLPASMNLILDGGGNNDTFTFGSGVNPAFIDGRGSLSVIGGDGYNNLIVDDAGGIGEAYSIRGLDNGEIPFDGIIDGPNAIPGNLFLYDGIQQVLLLANIDSNQIEVEGITPFMGVIVRATGNDDIVRVSNLANGVTVNLFGDGGNDQFEVWNIPSTATVNIVGDLVFGIGSKDRLVLGQGDLGTVRGDITFDGKDGEDSILLDDHAASMGHDLEFRFDSITGPGFNVQFASVEQIRLEGGAHDDIVDVESVNERTALDLYGNDGSDTFTIGRTSRNVDPIGGPVSVHGGSGQARGSLPFVPGPEDDDRLFIRDDYNPDPGEYLIDRDGSKYHGRVLKYAETRSDVSLRVMYDQIERTELHTDDDGDDIITVAAAPWFNQVWVHAGGGNDLIDVESSPILTATMQILAEGGEDIIRISPLAQDLGNLRSPVAIDGGLDQDILLVSDVSSSVGRVYGLGDTDLSRNGSAGLTYKALEELTIELTAADDSLSVTGLATGVAASVFALGGDDTFAVGDGDFTANIRGDLLLHGGFGIDSLLIDDRNGAAGSHTIDTDTYSKTPGTGTLSFSFMQDVRLETGNGSDTVTVNDTAAGFDLSIDTRAGNDTVRVHATAPATTLTIDTRSGDDTVEITPDGRDLDTIGGDIVLDAGKGNDNVIIIDQYDSGDDAYTVTTANVAKVNFLLNYGAVESLTLNANEGKNTIDVEGTLSSTALTVYAGGGNDHIHLNPATNRLNQIRGAVWVYGQAGFDTVHGHDELNALGTTYTLTRNRLSRPGFGGVNFETIDRLRLNMGSGNDTIHVQEFHRDVQYILNGNAGADTFHVTVHPTDLVTGGSLVVNGGGNPAGPGNGDRLHVVYDAIPTVPKEPDVQYSPHNPVPGSGTIAVNYADLDSLFDITYTGIEEVDLDKA